MTYSLKTLTSPTSAKAPAPPAAARFAHETMLILGMLALLFWLLALLSYSARDAAWSTSGAGSAMAGNWGGRLGAWLADMSYFLFGFSVWWSFAAGARAWLASLARWMRGSGMDAHSDDISRWKSSRMVFWGGLALLLVGSTVLEWSRLYRFEAALPGHSGGVLGYMLGPLSVKWLGFTGSGLASIVLVVAGMAWVFRFSWGHVAEQLGGRLFSLVETRREKREMAQDLEVGKQAARERE